MPELKTNPSLTIQALKHTAHCLVGCGIGEVVGMFLASCLGLHRPDRLVLAITLSFIFGYSLTYREVIKQTSNISEAIKIVLATDSISIISMELVDSIMELIIPNALIVRANQPRFWWGLGLSLAIAFMITVPVNRYMISKSPHQHMH